MTITNKNTRIKRRKIVVWITAGVLVFALFVALWVSIRAIMARDQLLAAIPIARQIQDSILSGDKDAIALQAAELDTRAAAAADLTSDPVWRSVELLPLLGPNLEAFRLAAGTIDDLSSDALPPLISLAGTFTSDGLAPKDGALDLQIFVDAAPQLAQASNALDAADEKAKSIDTTRTIQQIRGAVDQLVTLVSSTAETVSALDAAAALIPPMLGIDGPRDYLLMSLNNSELRASGGIAGALAVIHTDNGSISLRSQTSADALGPTESPALELSESETTLYGDVLGTYMQDVNSTPDFARTGELGRAIWQQKTGQNVDGVVSLDPVVLGYLLEAIGPIDTGVGIQLDSGNAADMLLNGVYTMFDDPNQQDVFFASVTGRIFDAVLMGANDNVKLLNGLDRGASEGRIHLWSAHPEEQLRLQGSTLAGEVPKSNDKRTAYGVYFNDSTGAKMDYYLDASIGIASAVCRTDERPNFEIQVKLRSNAPLDAASSLPAYVTGKGIRNISPGNIRTNVYIYAPSGSVPYSVAIDGVEYVFVASEHNGHSVAGITVELTPGESSTLSMKFVGVAGASDAVELQHTPMVRPVETSVDNFLDCADIPTSDDQTGA